MRELLDAIRDRPADDGPRLVYADWLTERGDPRGEFIQVQCALERALWWDEKSVALRARSDELLNRHRAQWEPKVKATGSFEWSFSRGFPSRVKASGAALVGAAAELIEAVPTLDAVIASRFELHPELFLSSVLLPRLNAVSLHYLQQPPPPREVLLRVLLDDPRFQHLKRLQISYTYLSLIEWEAIAASKLLPRLETLGLGLAHATTQSLEALMNAESSLRSFSVANGQVGTGGVRAIADSPHAKSLEDLDLSWNRIGVKGAVALAESDHLGRLQYLDLSHCQIGDDGCEALARGNLSALKALRLDQSRITRVGARLLCESQQLAQLRWVDLKNNGLDAQTLALSRARFS